MYRIDSGTAPSSQQRWFFDFSRKFLNDFQWKRRRSKTMGLMLVSDLDQTMVDRDDPENLSLLRFNSLWEAYYRQDSLLVFSTGRTLVKYKELRKKRPILTPDIIISSVGTEIAYGEFMVPDQEWLLYLNKKWDRSIVTEETAKFPDLTPRAEINQSPHKVSFDVEKDKALKLMKPLSESLKKRGLDVKFIYSNGIELDVLPKGAGKGEALAYLRRKLKLDRELPRNILVCGDSGNDAEMLAVPEVYGVMVSNALDELLEWHALNAKDNTNIIHATERGAAGIIQAIGIFNLGPNVSPRDMGNLAKYNVDNFNPCHEVVKLYLLCERWCRAEAETSEQYIQHLKSIFHESATVVHPCGVERSIDHCIDVMGESYGHKQGKQFRIWVDQVSSAQIGLDAWLVKFNKWEICGDEWHCCRTTVLLSSKPQSEMANGLTWMHIHQTWLYGSGPKDQTSWFF